MTKRTVHLGKRWVRTKVLELSSWLALLGRFRPSSSSSLATAQWSHSGRSQHRRPVIERVRGELELALDSNPPNINCGTGDLGGCNLGGGGCSIYRVLSSSFHLDPGFRFLGRIVDMVPMCFRILLQSRRHTTQFPNNFFKKRQTNLKKTRRKKVKSIR